MNKTELINHINQFNNPLLKGVNLNRLSIAELQSMINNLKDINIANEPSTPKTNPNEFVFTAYPQHHMIHIESYMGRGKGKKGLRLASLLFMDALQFLLGYEHTRYTLTNCVDKAGKPVYNMFWYSGVSTEEFETFLTHPSLIKDNDGRYHFTVTDDMINELQDGQADEFYKAWRWNLLSRKVWQVKWDEELKKAQ